VIGAWISVCCECCVLPGRGLCDGPITRLEESYRVCVCVSLCMTKFNNKAPQLQRVGRRGAT
jgi:hypothetical protein